MEPGVLDRLIDRKVSFDQSAPIIAFEPHPHMTVTSANLHGSILKPQNSRSSLRAPKSGDISVETTSLSSDTGLANYWPRWLSISLVCFINFMLSVQVFLYLSTLWPYLASIDPNATEQFFGAIVLCTNFASTLANPLFGYWSSRIKQCRTPIVAGIIIMTISVFVLAFVESFPVPQRKWVLLAVRTVAGFSYGITSVISAYVAMASTDKERATAMTFCGGSSAVGKALGPAVEIMFVPLGYPGRVLKWFHLDMYTAAAFANGIAGIVQIALMLGLFNEIWVGDVFKPPQQIHDDINKDVDSESNVISIRSNKVSPYEESKTSPGTEVKQQQTKEVEKVSTEPFADAPRSYDLVAVCSMIYIRFIFQFCTVYILTISAPYTMVMFGWSAADAVTYNGYISLGYGIFEILLCLLLGTFVLGCLSERMAMVIGFTCLLIFYLMTFSWPGLPQLVDVTQPDYINGSCAHPWCSHTTRIYLSQYVVGYAFLIISMCLVYIASSSLFSKLLETRDQSLFQGYYLGAGQAALTLNPVVATALYHFEGPRVAWAVSGSALLTAAVAMFIFWNRIVPRTELKLKQRNRNAKGH